MVKTNTLKMKLDEYTYFDYNLKIIVLPTSILKQLILNTPNDQELGSILRNSFS